MRPVGLKIWSSLDDGEAFASEKADGTTGRYPVKKFYAYRAASALAAIVTVVVASGAGQKWF